MSACRVIGEGGIERVIEIELNKTEQKEVRQVGGIGRAGFAKPASTSPLNLK
jgi:malate/lactate dehydrogenase